MGLMRNVQRRQRTETVMLRPEVDEIFGVGRIWATHVLEPMSCETVVQQVEGTLDSRTVFGFKADTPRSKLSNSELAFVCKLEHGRVQPSR